MPTTPTPYAASPRPANLGVSEEQIEYGFIGTLQNLKYDDRADGTPLNCTLVNLKDWCKNTFEVIHRLRTNPDVEKCLFVVDRKDLDCQTREEFNRFQDGCVEENTNTAALVRRLLSHDYADKAQLAPLQDKRIVFIFDECHRSQFGDKHQAIKAFSPQAQLFGFTGTSIFEANASRTQIEDENTSLTTTQDLFQKRLHADTITHAIEDANVLRCHVDYDEPKGTNPPKPGEGLSEATLRDGYTRFKQDPYTQELTAIATQHHLNPTALHTGVDGILQRMIFDGPAQPGLESPHPSRTRPHGRLRAPAHPTRPRRVTSLD